MYGVVYWDAFCSLAIGGECANGNPNQGCEPLPLGQCMNHYRG